MGKSYVIINHKINRVIGFIYRPTKSEKQFLSILGYEQVDYEYLDYDVDSTAPQNLFGDN